MENENIEYVCDFDSNDNMIVVRIPELGLLSDEENGIIKSKILEMYKHDQDEIKADCLYGDSNIDLLDLDELKEYLFNEEYLKDKDYDNDLEFIIKLLKDNLDISNDTIDYLRTDSVIYLIKDEDKFYSYDEILDQIDIDNYCDNCNITDAEFPNMKIGDKFVNQKWNMDFGCYYYQVITAEIIKGHLEGHGTIKFINSHDNMFGGSHNIYFEKGLWKCYGSGPSWHDIDSDFPIQDINEIVEYIMNEMEVQLI